jgi:hypothetical protein
VVTVRLTEAQARVAVAALAYWHELAASGEGDLAGESPATIAAARRAQEAIAVSVRGAR